MRKSSAAVTLGVTALVAASLTACGNDTDYDEVDADHAQVCRDEETQERVDDSECEGSSSGHRHHHTSWFFVPIMGGRFVPGVGSRLTEGSTTRPSGTTTRVGRGGGNMAKSGSVSRGGFGGKGGGSKGG